MAELHELRMIESRRDFPAETERQPLDAFKVGVLNSLHNVNNMTHNSGQQVKSHRVLRRISSG